MFLLTLAEAAAAAHGRLIGCEEELLNTRIRDITLDSRRAAPGSMFIAVRGERTDGHDYAAEAMARGAVCTVCERPVPGRMLLVSDTLRAMQDIAAYMRVKSGVRVIAVTGSVGKTTTRRMLTGVLSKRFRVLSTEGNFNNEYGLPQTLFRLESEHELAVLELGISHFGEMSRLGAVARPDYAVITNIGVMHLENLIDRDGVLRAKTELIKYMPASGRLFLNGEDDKLRSFEPPLACTYYGLTPEYPVYASEIEQEGMERTRFTLHCHGGTARVLLPAAGRHVVLSAIAAANVGHELRMELSDIAAGIEDYEPVGHRGRILHAGGVTIVDDCYNAGPDSMRAAIGSLSGGGRKAALLGDMLELGEGAEAYHAELGRYCAEAGLDALFTVGTLAERIADGARSAGMRDVYSLGRGEAADAAAGYLRPGDVLLVKASRGMRFEELTSAVASRLDGTEETNLGTL